MELVLKKLNTCLIHDCGKQLSQLFFERLSLFVLPFDCPKRRWVLIRILM